ncbi:unnamed protein product, partial [Rotaria sp. Silwood2]
PVRVSVQGEVIRDLDTNNGPSSRKTEHADSDEEDQSLQSNLNGRGVMNLYQQRQQKRVKLTATAINADQP